MRRVLIVFFTICCSSTLFAQNETASNAEQAKVVKQRLTVAKKLRKEVDEAFANYRQAQIDAMIFVCAKRVANYNGQTLAKTFDADKTNKLRVANAAQKQLHSKLSEAKKVFGTDFNKIVNGFFEFEEEHQNLLSPDKVTRGYCYSYTQAGLAKEITETLSRYATSSSNEYQGSKMENTLYLSPKYQLTSFAKPKAKQPPTLMFIGTEKYFTTCEYKNVQAYKSAIITGPSIDDTAYQASKLFYEQSSPQIDSILVCKTDKSLPTQTEKRFSDTYPWFQPMVKGGDTDEPAAGNSLVYANQNEIAIVLGHEPCACNKKTQSDCSQLKDVSRDYNKHLWEVLASLEEKQQKNKNILPEQRRKLNSYIRWAKTEAKKDFCFINKEEIRHRLLLLLK